MNKVIEILPGGKIVKIVNSVHSESRLISKHRSTSDLCLTTRFCNDLSTMSHSFIGLKSLENLVVGQKSDVDLCLLNNMDTPPGVGGSIPKSSDLSDFC